MAKTVTYFPNCKKCKTPLGAPSVNEPVSLTLRFTRPQNPSEVFLVLTKDNESPVHYPMNLVRDEDGEYTYSIAVKITTGGLYFYHFEIQNEDSIYRVGSDSDLTAMLGKGGEWQLTVTSEEYAPTVLDGGVMYEIMPDRFCIGGERKKTKPYATYRDDWGGCPEYRPQKDGRVLNTDFFGGNIKGIIKKLPYLQSLGVTALCLTPIFEAHSNHKYDTGNYMRVDPDFGTEDELKELIKKAARRGISVILDGTFSHTGADSVYFNREGNYESVGAFESANSPYIGWYKFNHWNSDYECRYNIDIMPVTDDGNIMFDEFITGVEGVVSRWTRLGLGGWRLIACEQLSDEFVRHCARAAKRENPNAVIYGEMSVDPTNLIVGGERKTMFSGGKLDSVTNFPFKEDILDFVRCGDSRRLNNTVAYVLNNYPKHSVDSLMNILDTHDTARLLTVLGDNCGAYTAEDKAAAKIIDRDNAIKLVKLATALQYTLPGIPCIYYGDEVGMEGFDDPFNRRCFPWEGGDTRLFNWYKKLGKMRKAEREIFAHGKYCGIDTEHGVMFFARKTESDALYIIVNNSGSTYAPELPEGEYSDIMSYKPFGGTVADKSVAVVKLTQNTVFPQKRTAKK